MCYSTDRKPTSKARRSKLKDKNIAPSDKISTIFKITLAISVVSSVGLTAQLFIQTKHTPLFDINEPPPCDEDSLDDTIFSYNSQNKDLFKSSERSNVSVFYNIFIAASNSTSSEEKPATKEEAFSIIKEQLDSRSASIYPEAPLYFMTIGEDIGYIPNCTNCEHLEHNSVGDEVLTLSKVHEFCSKYPDKNVAYIHNKGSFHPSRKNDLYRRMLTKAVFSDECLSMKNPMNKRTSYGKRRHCDCNVCSARFSPLPHFHTPGNMWVSKCSYLSKLIPPDIFGKKMDRLVQCAPTSRFGKATEIIFCFTGRDRFSSEHWVHSHPDNCPCDVYPGTYIWAYDRLPSNDMWKPDLKYAPRFPMIEDYEELGYYLSLRKVLQGSWFSMVGRIYEWKALYGKIPDESSWVWDYYGNSDTYNVRE